MKKGKQNIYKVRSKIWLYPGMAGWHFLSVPKAQSIEIKKKHGGEAKGWGSLPVNVAIGETTWKTSIFPDRTSNTYLLPLKATIRKKEGLFEGDLVSYTLTILV